MMTLKGIVLSALVCLSAWAGEPAVSDSPRLLPALSGTVVDGLADRYQFAFDPGRWACSTPDKSSADATYYQCKLQDSTLQVAVGGHAVPATMQFNKLVVALFRQSTGEVVTHYWFVGTYTETFDGNNLDTTAAMEWVDEGKPDAPLTGSLNVDALGVRVVLIPKR